LKTPIANMIADMHGKGIPVELIVSAVATLEEAMAARAVSTGQENVRPVDTSTIDKRRAWDRERKRRKREMERSAEMSANSTGHPPESGGIPPDVSSILSSKEGAPNKEVTEEVKEKKESKRIARGTRIPPDFTIDNEDRAFAASIGIPPDAVEAETPQFIDYWSSVAGAKGVKLNWKATWRNRMRDIKKYQPTGVRNGQRTGNPRASGHAAIFAAGLRAARKIVGDGEMAGPADEGEFSFGDGAVGGRTKAPDGPAGRDSAGNDRRKSGSEGVLEGEIIAPDKPHAGISGGWKHH
jgi:hypothetical protein